MKFKCSYGLWPLLLCSASTWPGAHQLLKAGPVNKELPVPVKRQIIVPRILILRGDLSKHLHHGKGLDGLCVCPGKRFGFCGLGGLLKTLNKTGEILQLDFGIHCGLMNGLAVCIDYTIHPGPVSIITDESI